MIFISIYLYICIFLYLYISKFVYFYISIFVYFYISIFVYFYISIFVYIYIYLFIYISIYLYICMYIYSRRLRYFFWIYDFFKQNLGLYFCQKYFMGPCPWLAGKSPWNKGLNGRRIGKIDHLSIFYISPLWYYWKDMSELGNALWLRS